MDYQKIHDLIIENAKKRKLNGYIENHHILPKCMGGSDDMNNIVALTPREHFIIHKLLTKIYPNNHKLHYAVWIMATTNNGYYKIGAREYERIRNNIVVSDETREKMRKANLGKQLSTEVKEKIRKGKLGKTHTEKSKEKMRKPKSEQHKANLSKSKKGFPNWAKGVKNRWTELQLSQNRNNQPTVMMVNQYSKTGEFIKTWDSITETKKICSGVWHCLNGIQETSGGYIWKYVDTQKS